MNMVPLDVSPYEETIITKSEDDPSIKSDNTLSKDALDWANGYRSIAFEKHIPRTLINPALLERCGWPNSAEEIVPYNSESYKMLRTTLS